MLKISKSYISNGIVKQERDFSDSTLQSIGKLVKLCLAAMYYRSLHCTVYVHENHTKKSTLYFFYQIRIKMPGKALNAIWIHFNRDISSSTVKAICKTCGATMSGIRDRMEKHMSKCPKSISDYGEEWKAENGDHQQESGYGKKTLSV